MDLLEIYVTNITFVRPCRYGYVLIADKDDYGHIEKQVKIILSKKDYESVKRNGYYMG